MTNWTNEMTETLKQMYTKGDAFSIIGRELGVTRNAAIGKAHRMGLDKRKPAQPDRPPRPKRTRVNASALKARPAVESTPRTVKDAIVEWAAREHPHAVTILGLEARSCRWPLGEPAHDMLYCGAHTIAEGHSYCLDHTRRSISTKRHIE